jgi:hypothetical protein
MKPIKTLICVMTMGTMIFAAGKASASLGVVNVSGTALSESTNSPSPGVLVGKVTKHSFNTKYVLSLLAQATTNTWFTDKRSQLVYDPDAYNAEATTNYNNALTMPVFGIFYVTNTSTHAVFRLDGFDGANYWSYVEFDAQPGERGFWSDPNLGENTATSGTQNKNTDKSSLKTTQHGLLYIHDNQLAYNITDFPGINFDNDNAIIIRGLGVFSDSSTPTMETESFSLGGSGDGMFSGDDVVIQGKITFKSKGPPPPG